MLLLETVPIKQEETECKQNRLGERRSDYDRGKEEEHLKILMPLTYPQRVGLSPLGGALFPPPRKSTSNLL